MRLLISMYYVRKGSWFFILITHISTQSENLITWTTEPSDQTNIKGAVSATLLSLFTSGDVIN